MATFYWYIRAVSKPIDIGLDKNLRPTYSVNFNCTAVSPADRIDEQVLQRLVDDGISVISGPGINTFSGSAATIPKTGGTFIYYQDTGGTVSDRTQEDSRYDNASFRLTVRDEEKVISRSVANQIFESLDGISNETLSP